MLKKDTQYLFPKISQDSAINLLTKQLSHLNLLNKTKENTNVPDKTIKNNREFWEAVLHSASRPLNWIELVNFKVTDWFPSSPGVYHTSKARQAREEANRHLTYIEGMACFDPYGKSHMVDGGIGSVRFKPQNIEGIESWICTATSDQYCHSGIPIIVPESVMSKIGFGSRRKFKIVGQLKFLPDSFSSSYYTHLVNIPQVYIHVDNVLTCNELEQGCPVKITPIAFFEGQAYGEEQQQLFQIEREQYATFMTCHADVISEIDQAVVWLEKYVENYDGKIITNFDQQRPVFAYASFSLQRVFRGKIDFASINSYNINHAVIEKLESNYTKVFQEVHEMTNIKLDIGDGNIINAPVVAAHSISNSFHQIETSSLSVDMKSLLKELSVEVGKMVEQLPPEQASEVARDLKTLTDEAISEKPRRKWWELSVDGLKDAAKTVGEIGQPVIETAAKVALLLSGMPSG